MIKIWAPSGVLFINKGNQGSSSVNELQRCNYWNGRLKGLQLVQKRVMRLL